MYFLLHRDGARRLGLRLSNEASLVSAVSIMREVASGPVAPLEVHFGHAAPDTLTAHEAYFGCLVVLNLGWTGSCSLTMYWSAPIVWETGRFRGSLSRTLQKNLKPRRRRRRSIRCCCGAFRVA
ncbi:AraC family transcriptional regulator ligand-binding domain-containing protein [Jannaschia faecimaris]|uniref:AraC family transcriptional regulator ligand-binding domain-containing protein n=1 Tax=Jannaschia faecimaris TaxID=1244108 RepID=UPI003CC7A325